MHLKQDAEKEPRLYQTAKGIYGTKSLRTPASTSWSSQVTDFEHFLCAWHVLALYKKEPIYGAGSIWTPLYRQDNKAQKDEIKSHNLREIAGLRNEIRLFGHKTNSKSTVITVHLYFLWKLRKQRYPSTVEWHRGSMILFCLTVW